MKTLTILSGKGGVGKSSITASLAYTLSKDKSLICADCDVDASNLSLVFGIDKPEEWKDLSTDEEPVFDPEKCISCKRCFNACHFNAIGWKDDKPYLKASGCEGCGVCEIVCPQNAIHMESKKNAKIGFANTSQGFKVVFSQLNIGASGSGKVVFEVRKKAVELAPNADMLIIDSAAGIGCPVIASVTGSDYAIIVTEPTPSGFSDMKKAFDVVNHFKIPCGIIINKADLDRDYSRKIEEFARKLGITILIKINFDRQFPSALVARKPVVVYDTKYKIIFDKLKGVLLKELEKII